MGSEPAMDEATRKRAPHARSATRSTRPVPRPPYAGQPPYTGRLPAGTAVHLPYHNGRTAELLSVGHALPAAPYSQPADHTPPGLGRRVNRHPTTPQPQAPGSPGPW